MIEIDTLKICQPPFILFNSSKGIGIKPNSAILDGVKMLFRIMNNIIDDFIVKTKQFENSMVPIPGYPKMYDFKDMDDAIAFPDLLYLSLTSYITTFFSLECGLKRLYADFNSMNNEFGLNISHSKLPKQNEYIEKLWHVRNKSIAHWGEKVSKNNIQAFLDHASGNYIGAYSYPTNPNGPGYLLKSEWGAMGCGGCIDQVTGKWVEPRDKMLKPLPETHEICLEYINEIDNICTEYFVKIKGCLPITQNGIEYTLTRIW